MKIKKKSNNKRWNFGISRGPIPFGYWPRVSLSQFKQLHFFKSQSELSIKSYDRLKFFRSKFLKP